MKLIILRKIRILSLVILVCLLWLSFWGLGSGKKVSDQDPAQSGGDAANMEVTGTESWETEKGTTAITLPDAEEYFVNFRIEREKVRSHQMEMLQEMVANPHSDQESRKKAQDKLFDLTENWNQELKLESLIMAKNFADAVAFIQPESVVVVIKSSALDVDDTTVIADLAVNVTGHSYDQIVVAAKK